MRALYIGFALFMLVFGGAGLFLFKNILEQKVAEQSIASAAIVPPPGVGLAAYTASDGEELTGVTYDAEGAGHINAILGRFAAAAKGANDGIAHVFSKGEERVALLVRRAAKVEPVKQNAFAQLAAINAKPKEPLPDPVFFGHLSGFETFWQPAPKLPAGAVPVKFRHLTASIGVPADGPTLAIEVITNASDATVAAALSALDVAAMNAKLDAPWPDVPQITAFAPAGPLSDTPPPPSLAYQAYILLQSDDWSEADRTLLTLMRDGAVTGLADLAEREMRLSDHSEAVVTVFASANPTVGVRLAAEEMLQNGANLSALEAYVLGQIATPAITQADLAEFLGADREVSADIRALAAQLPG